MINLAFSPSAMIVRGIIPKSYPRVRACPSRDRRVSKVNKKMVPPSHIHAFVRWPRTMRDRSSAYTLDHHAFNQLSWWRAGAAWRRTAGHRERTVGRRIRPYISHKCSSGSEKTSVGRRVVPIFNLPVISVKAKQSIDGWRVTGPF